MKSVSLLACSSAQPTHPSTHTHSERELINQRIYTKYIFAFICLSVYTLKHSREPSEGARARERERTGRLRDLWGGYKETEYDAFSFFPCVSLLESPNGVIFEPTIVPPTIVQI